MREKLKDILSRKICNKISNYLGDKNKLLIEDLINSNKGGRYFKKLFDLTFLDCLEHIRGTKNFVELNGLMEIDEMLNCEEFKIDKNVIDDFESYEEIINTKKSRPQKKKLNNVQILFIIISSYYVFINRYYYLLRLNKYIKQL